MFDWKKHLRSLVYSVLTGAVAGFVQWTQTGEFGTLSTFVAMFGSYILAQSDKLLRSWIWPDDPTPPPSPPPPPNPPSDGGTWATAPAPPPNVAPAVSLDPYRGWTEELAVSL